MTMFVFLQCFMNTKSYNNSKWYIPLTVTKPIPTALAFCIARSMANRPIAGPTMRDRRNSIYCHQRFLSWFLFIMCMTVWFWTARCVLCDYQGCCSPPPGPWPRSPWRPPDLFPDHLRWSLSRLNEHTYLNDERKNDVNTLKLKLIFSNTIILTIPRD